MIISSVEYLNLDTLYQLMSNKLTDPNYKRIKFGSNLQRLYRHTAITFHIKDITAYECIFLKMYASNISEFEATDISCESIGNKETFEKITAFSSLLNEIYLKEEYRNSPDFLIHNVPAGTVVGECSATFTGIPLIYLLNLDPVDFFIKSSNKKCILNSENFIKESYDSYNDNIEFDTSYDVNKDTDVENYLIQKFISTFYKFMVDKATYIDLASDSNNFSFVSNMKQNTCQIVSLRSNEFLIDLLHDNPDYIMKTLNLYKEKNYYSNYTMENINFEIMLNTSFSVFQLLFRLIPYERFGYLGSFKLASRMSMDSTNIPECPKEFIKEYSTRWNTRLDYIASTIATNYQSEEKLVSQLEFTENYIPFQYSMIISLNDINNYFQYFNKINKESKSYDVLLTLDIIDKIIKFATYIYKSIS